MSHARAQHLYRQSETAALSPGERILKTYAVALDACAQKNGDLLLRALTLLAGALRYEAAPELAQNLHGLYAHCYAAASAKDFEATEAVLRPLQAQWEIAVKNAG